VFSASPLRLPRTIGSVSNASASAAAPAITHRGFISVRTPCTPCTPWQTPWQTPQQTPWPSPHPRLHVIDNRREILAGVARHNRVGPLVGAPDDRLRAHLVDDAVASRVALENVDRERLAAPRIHHVGRAAVGGEAAAHVDELELTRRLGLRHHDRPALVLLP